MKIKANVVEESGEQYRQVVRLETGLYGGMFARYSKPGQYKKYNSEDSEEKFFVTVVVTHDAAARSLPHFSEAFAGIRTKAFYDPGTGMKSTFVAFWEALMNGKMTPEQVCQACKDDTLPDLDDKIGQPLRIFVVASTKPNKNGLFVNKIDTGRGGFEKPDKQLSTAILPIWKAIDAHYDTEGLRYLKSPSAVFESDVPADESSDEHSDDEIPF